MRGFRMLAQHCWGLLVVYRHADQGSASFEMHSCAEILTKVVKSANVRCFTYSRQAYCSKA